MYILYMYTPHLQTRMDKGTCMWMSGCIDTYTYTRMDRCICTWIDR